ncbi:MAG: acyltransferase [Treponemataceae bacterium]
MHKVKYLDGLRGCAALIVVLHHFAASFYPATYLGADVARHSPFDILFLTTPLGILVAGNFSVCVFFVLSGYVLSVKFFKTNDVRVLTGGAMRRYFRLLPPVVFSMAVAWLFMVFDWFPVEQAAALSGSDRWLAKCWDFTPNFQKFLAESFFGVFFKYEASYNSVLWTMSYEFIGSILVFSSAALLGSTPRRRWVLAIMTVFLIKTYFAAFFIGMILSDISVRDDWFYRRIGHPVVTGVLAAVGLFLGAYPSFTDIDSSWYGFLKLETTVFGYAPTFYHLIGASCVMTAVLSSRRIQAFFSHKAALFLGRISFSMYAMHVILIGSFSCALFIALRAHMGYNAAAMLTFFPTLVLTLVIGALVDRFVDQPGVRLSAKIQERLLPLD